MTIGVGQAFIENSGTTSGGNVTQTGSITTAASGSSFLAVIRAYGSPTGVTDSKGNTYVLVFSTQNTTDTDWLAVYMATNGTGGATHRITASFGAGLNPVILGLIEITGGATSSITDTSATAFDQASPFGQSITTANANDLILGFFGSNGAATTVTYTAGSGFTMLAAGTFVTGTDGLSVGVSTQVVSATGTYNPAFTVSSGNKGPTISLALKQLAGGGGGTLLLRPRGLDGGIQGLSGGMNS
jgi:type II secretory pathway component HofQ